MKKFASKLSALLLLTVTLSACNYPPDTNYRKKGRVAAFSDIVGVWKGVTFNGVTYTSAQTKNFFYIFSNDGVVQYTSITPPAYSPTDQDCSFIRNKTIADLSGGEFVLDEGTENQVQEHYRIHKERLLLFSNKEEFGGGLPEDPYSRLARIAINELPDFPLECEY